MMKAARAVKASKAATSSKAAKASKAATASGPSSNTSGLIEATVAGAWMERRLAQPAKAPAAMAVQPSRMAAEPTPGGTRRSVTPEAS